jgi:hypothetical protein
MNSYSNHPLVKSHLSNPRTALSFDKLIDRFLGIAVYRKVDITEPFEVPIQALKQLKYYNFSKLSEVFIKRVGSYTKGENGIKGKCYSYQFTKDFFQCEIDFTDTKQKELAVDYDYNCEAVSRAVISLKELTVKENKTTIRTVKQANHYFKKWLTGSITKSYISKRLSIDFENKTYQKKGVTIPINGDIKEFVNLKVAAAQISAGYILNEIRQGYFYCSVSPTNGRLNSSFTSLAEVLTPYLRLNDSPIKGLDLSNSQFLLLSHLLENCLPNSEKKLFNFIDRNGFSNELLGKQGNKYSIGILISRMKNIVSKSEITPDFNIFLNHSFNGTLYSDFAERTRQTRAQAKVSFFAILFGKCRISDAAKTFKKLYPSVFKITNEFKEQTDYTTLSIFLQKIESLIFIERIAPNFTFDESYTLFKHDSVYVSNKEYNNYYKIIKEMMNDVMNNKYRLI